MPHATRRVAIAFNREVVREWLLHSDEGRELTRQLAIDDPRLFGVDRAGFLTTVEDLIDAYPDGVDVRSDIDLVAVFRTVSGTSWHDGALVTVDLTNGIRLASVHQEATDFSGRRGLEAALDALEHVSALVNDLVDVYERQFDRHSRYGRAGRPRGWRLRCANRMRGNGGADA